MQKPPQIHFRGMDPSSAVEAAILERVESLERFHDRITSCNVVVEAPHRHSHSGRIYQVRVDVSVPGGEIIVGQAPESTHAHEDVLVAVRDSFDAARRQLEDFVRRMSGYRVKPHPEKLHGTVVRLVPEDGFGFIATDDGTEFFFRRESMSSVNQWPQLKQGSELRFTAHEGEQGPYASAVSLT